MIRICIIDDDINEINILYTLVNDFFSTLTQSFEILTKANVDDILDQINNIDILFLDIELKNINGIDFAKEIRTQNNDLKIILISNYTKYLVDGYKIRADRYFLKPIDKLEFFYEMNDVLKDFIMRNQFILDKNISNTKIYVNDIFYLEVLNRKTILHTLDYQLKYSYTLKWWEDYLSPYCFVQTHRAFLVNMYNISSFNNTSITLLNNEKVPLSNTYKDNFEITYSKFLNGVNR